MKAKWDKYVIMLERLSNLKAKHPGVDLTWSFLSMAHRYRRTRDKRGARRRNWGGISPAKDLPAAVVAGARLFPEMAVGRAEARLK